MKKAIVPILVVCSLLIATGCDRSSEDGETRSGEASNSLALKLVIPSHEKTPDVDLTYRVEPADESQVDVLKAPIGNVVYLSLRDCPQTHPDKGKGSLVAVDFVIEQGRVTEAKPRPVRQKKQAGEPVGESAEACVIEQVKDRKVDFPEQAGELADKRLEVAAQARLHWRGTEPNQ
jgi:hypothetical protein